MPTRIADDYDYIHNHMRGLRTEQTQQPADIVKWIEDDIVYYMARTPHGVEVLSCWMPDNNNQKRYPFTVPGITPEQLVDSRSINLPIIERLEKAP